MSSSRPSAMAKKAARKRFCLHQVRTPSSEQWKSPENGNKSARKTREYTGISPVFALLSSRREDILEEAPRYAHTWELQGEKGGKLLDEKEGAWGNTALGKSQ